MQGWQRFDLDFKDQIFYGGMKEETTVCVLQGGIVKKHGVLIVGEASNWAAGDVGAMKK